MATGKKDVRANVLLHDVTESAANTLTFDEIQVGLNLFDKVGLNIHRIEWFFSNDVLGDMDVDAWLLQAALVSSNSIASLGSAERAVIAKVEMYCNRVGTPTSFEMNKFPMVTSWEDLPEGGLLVPPKPLYLGIKGTNASAAQQAYARIFFTIVQLKDADYFELLETFRFYD